MANLDKKLFDALVEGVVLEDMVVPQPRTVGDLLKISRQFEERAEGELDRLLKKSPLVPAVEALLSKKAGTAVKLKREGLTLVYEGGVVEEEAPENEPTKVSRKKSKKSKASKRSKTSKVSKKSSKQVEGDGETLFAQHMEYATLPVKAELQVMADWLGVSIDEFGKGRKEPWAFLQEVHAKRQKEEAGVEIDEVTEIPVEEEAEAAPVEEPEEAAEDERKTIILVPKSQRKKSKGRVKTGSPAPAKTIKQEMLDEFTSIDDLLDHGSVEEEEKEVEPASEKKKTKYDLIMDGIKNVDLDAILAADPKDALKLAGMEPDE